MHELYLEQYMLYNVKPSGKSGGWIEDEFEDELHINRGIWRKKELKMRKG